MKKIIPILIFVILIGVVAGTYLLGTSNQEGLPATSNYEDTIQLLNQSDNVKQVEITQIDEKINKEKTVSTENSSDIIPKEQITEKYQQIFNHPESNSTVEVSGPYKMDNGTLYYDVIVYESYDDMTTVMHIEADAKTMPEDVSKQNLIIRGALSLTYSNLQKDNGNITPKLSTSDIEKIAKQDMQKYYPSFINDTQNRDDVNPNQYDIELYYTQLTNQPVYRVNYGPELIHLMYDGNTGEIIYRDMFGYGYEGLYESLGPIEAIRLGHIELSKYCQSNNLPDLDMDELGNYTNDEGQVVYQYTLSHDSKEYGTMEINSVTQEVTININQEDNVTIEENTTVEVEDNTTEEEGDDIQS